MLGKLLRETRTEKNQTLKDISESTGFGQMYLSEIERGKKVPKTGQTLKRLADGYSISLSVIMHEVINEIEGEIE